jgi:hypothetical protein
MHKDIERISNAMLCRTCTQGKQHDSSVGTRLNQWPQMQQQKHPSTDTEVDASRSRSSTTHIAHSRRTILEFSGVRLAHEIRAEELLNAA